VIHSLRRQGCQQGSYLHVEEPRKVLIEIGCHINTEDKKYSCTAARRAPVLKSKFEVKDEGIGTTSTEPPLHKDLRCLAS
jgi:hypothetical protein